LNETAKKDKNKNSGKKADANFNESMAEQKINWIGKLEPNSEEALTMFEALKKDEIANQAQLRLARISGRYIFFFFAFCESLCPSLTFFHWSRHLKCSRAGEQHYIFHISYLNLILMKNATQKCNKTSCCIVP
jgi:hypothetical protein